MKEVLNNLVGKNRVTKQKVKKEKFRTDGTRKKVIERETEFESVQPSTSSEEKA